MNLKRIDVHAHYVPDFYRGALERAGHARPDGMPAIPGWSSASAIDAMDSLNIKSAILSITAPGVHFGDDAAARALARQVNEDGSKLVSDYPNRFGLFASLPLPDVEGAIAEAIYALDVLKADGVILETNHHGMYLGDAKLEPLFSELNRRNAIVFIHPTSPHCSCCATTSFGYPRPMMEFIFETTRSVVNMLLSGVLDRHQNLRIIVPHGGAAIPVIAERIALLLSYTSANPMSRDQLFGLLRRMHYDLAGAPVPHLLGALLQIADKDKIFYGSDWPFTPLKAVTELAAKLDDTPLLDEQTRRLVYFENAIKLFPRFS